MMTRLSVLLLTLAINVAISDENSQFYAPRQFCGSRLADELKILCKTKYYERNTTPRPRKRSRPSDPAWDYNGLNDYEYKTISDPNTEIALEEPSDFLRFPSKRKITEECCDKACTVDELKSYCGR